MIAFQGIAWLLYIRAAKKDSPKARGNYYP
jgi:hypothetical protein